MFPVALFLLCIRIFPEKGQDLQAIIRDIACILEDQSTDVTFLNKFRVTAEASVLAIVQVSDITALEGILGRLYTLGAIDTDFQPLIRVEDFARNLGVGENLTGIITGILQKESIYW